MSTKIEFRWKPGTLESVQVRKVMNGFTVRVMAHDVPGACLDYVFARFPDVLELLSECFCWDIAPEEEDAAEPAPVATPASAAYPSRFLRFEVNGADVQAVFRELRIEQSYSPSQLAARIDTLKLCSPTAKELAKWEAVLTDVRRAAAITRKV